MALHLTSLANGLPRSIQLQNKERVQIPNPAAFKEKPPRATAEQAGYTRFHPSESAAPTHRAEHARGRTEATAAVISPVDETISVSYIEPFYCSQTFIAMSFLSLSAGTANVRLPRAQLPVPLQMVPGLVSAALRAGGAEGAVGDC